MEGSRIMGCRNRPVHLFRPFRRRWRLHPPISAPPDLEGCALNSLSFPFKLNNLGMKGNVSMQMQIVRQGQAAPVNQARPAEIVYSVGKSNGEVYIHIDERRTQNLLKPGTITIKWLPLTPIFMQLQDWSVVRGEGKPAQALDRVTPRDRCTPGFVVSILRDLGILCPDVPPDSIQVSERVPERESLNVDNGEDPDPTLVEHFAAYPSILRDRGIWGIHRQLLQLPTITTVEVPDELIFSPAVD